MKRRRQGTIDRIGVLKIFFCILAVIVVARLFYWQVLSHNFLQALADAQHLLKMVIPARRGRIFTSDDYLLVDNRPAYLIYADLVALKQDKDLLSHRLAKVFLDISDENWEACASIQNSDDCKLVFEREEQEAARLYALLNQKGKVWVYLKRKASQGQKQKIESWGFEGIGFQEESVRVYPEASMSAHLLGFVGQDINGEDKGYFGLEGFYDLELKGRAGYLQREKDAWGRPIMIGQTKILEAVNGKDLKTNIERPLQYFIEEKLRQAMVKYGASAGSVTVIDPVSCGVMAMASQPSFDPLRYEEFDTLWYKNSVISDLYEPGSTFKIVVMASALDAGVVEPDSVCQHCDGPRVIGRFTIRNWNDVYHPDSTITDVLVHSDNVGMIFVGESLGKQKMQDYLKAFGLGQKTGIDLEGEVEGSLKNNDDWGFIDLATTSFGQGVAVTPIQMVMMATYIARDGLTCKPRVVSEIIGDNKSVELGRVDGLRIISKQSADQVTNMMLEAVERGEAKWTKLRGWKIAGKTGTAQIPIAGHYDKEKTIASFVGFAPSDEPRFVMLVTLREPKTSPWGSETAAPLFFEIARDILLYFGIPQQ